MYLFFDCETTSLFNKKLPLDHPDQARIVQFAMMVMDKEFNEVCSLSSLIKPDGWLISSEAQNIHGISLEKCSKFGQPMCQVTALFREWSFACSYRIAHNSQFDTKMLDVEYAHEGGGFDSWADVLCTMQAMTPICKLPGKYGNQYKWPTLAEAYRFATGKDIENAHDALVDVKACAAVFKWLVLNGKITLPVLNYK